MTTGIDQIALDTAQSIEDALLRSYHTTAQRRVALQVIVANAIRTSQLAAPYTLGEPDVDGWIAWNGAEDSECPVDRHVMVECRFDLTRPDYTESDIAGRWRWSVHKQPGWRNITAYRVIKEPTK